MIHLIKHALRLLKTEGLLVTVKRCFAWLLVLVKPKSKSFIDIRSDLASRLEEDFGGRVVQHGPFRGLRLYKESAWCGGELGSMLLGVYETEVQDVLVSLSHQNETFVDIGAADGYFAVGVLVAGLFDQSVCFEVDSSSRKILHRNAVLNQVQDKTLIFEKAEHSFLLTLEEVDGFDYAKTVFLIDIEGFELEILTVKNLEKMRYSTIVLETHRDFVGATKQDEFENLLSTHHLLTEVKTGARNPGSFVELDDWTDDERWLVFSEGRPRRGRWLVLEPKFHVAANLG
jgi:hypothetical protein